MLTHPCLRYGLIGWILGSTSFLLTGCFYSDKAAPVTAIQHPIAPQRDHYRAKPGDTLYSIAWAYGVTVRHLATLNGLRAPYVVEPGQWVRLHGQGVRSVQGHGQTVQSKRSPSAVRPPSSAQPKASPLAPIKQRHFQWQWPTQISQTGHFGVKQQRSGLWIPGVLGQPIRAAAPGRVVYVGRGIRGYGLLILIKHRTDQISAYAFCQRATVMLGQSVKPGQQLARIGQNPQGKAGLYFEIRQRGQAIDPWRLLPR